MNHWSTQHVNPSEKFSYWREVLCQAYTTLDPVTGHDRNFAGSVSSGKLAEIDITSISSRDQKISRGFPEIRRNPTEYYFLNLQISGQCLMQQGENSALIGPGEFSLVDSNRPYINDYLSDNFQQYSFRIPQFLLKPLLLRDDARFTSRFCSDGTIGTLTIDFLRTLASSFESYPQYMQSRLQENLLNLLCLALGAKDPSNEETKQTYQGQLLQSIKIYMRQNICDHELSPQKVANNFRVSVRYLHKVFEQSTESFGRHMLTIRLEKCAEELLHNQHSSISAIAFKAGFNDSSHFSKTFKAHFSMSPRDYRLVSFGKSPNFLN